MDELLLKRARNGDAAAFEQLMTLLESRVWRVCWHYTGNRENAEDCAQETMLRVWRGLASYRGDCAFETWVSRIAANCCLDLLRKKKGDKSVSIEPLREAGYDPADPAPGTSEQAEAAEDRRRLRECIAMLPEEQREALVLTQLEGVPYAEAARELRVTEGTLKSRINRAKQRLKELFDSGAELSAAENVWKSETGKERRERS